MRERVSVKNNTARDRILKSIWQGGKGREIDRERDRE